MNVAGLELLIRFDMPRPSGLKIFPINNINWDYVYELSRNSPNGITIYSCDRSMNLWDGPIDLRYPKFPAYHELPVDKIEQAFERLSLSLEDMKVPRTDRGIIVYSSMANECTLYSITGLRRVSRKDSYWGYGDIIFEIMPGLRPSWDWNPLCTVSFPTIWGVIQWIQPTILSNGNKSCLLDTILKLTKYLIIEGTAKFDPSKEFGFEAAVFTEKSQNNLGVSQPFWIYDYYHISINQDRFSAV